MAKFSVTKCFKNKNVEKQDFKSESRRYKELIHFIITI